MSSKYFDKKAKLSANLSVGDSPQVTPGSLENASLVAWTEILTQTERIAKDRSRLASEFNLQIADQLSGTASKYDGLRRTAETYSEKLIEDRDNFYSDLKKSKSAYDAACQSMENQRLKVSKSSSDKANRKAEEKEHEMNNAKNNYLIKINVANRVKDKYYQEDIPELLDTLQLFNQSRVNMLNNFWKQAVDLEKSCCSRTSENLGNMVGIIDQNNPALDGAMFVKHNLKSWTEPNDFVYEPSPIWHEDEEMITKDSASLQYLKERLAESLRKLDNYQQISSNKIDDYKRVLDAENEMDIKKITPYIQYLMKRLSVLQGLTQNESLRLIYDVEVETIQSAVNGKDLAALPDAPTKKSRGIFGRKSHTSKPSGDQASVASTGTSGPVHQHGGFVSSILGRSRGSKNSTSANDGQQHAKVLYSYDATTDDEATIREGDQVAVIEVDDGSGWTGIKQANGSQGLVPTSYLEMINTVSSNDSQKKKGPAVAPKRGAKKVSYMIAQYDYDAQGSDELTVRAGDKIQIISEDQGDGWTEGELQGMSGLFPTQYAKEA